MAPRPRRTRRPRRPRWLPARLLPILLPTLLAACAGTARGPSYLAGGTELECAPFARQATGLDLHGDAYRWWAEAAGRYLRTSAPAPGSVLVFEQTSRLPSGHVSVVAALVTPREILVDQANWVHHRISHREPVLDVSPANDWTQVRVWWSPAGQVGTTTYPTYGFILPQPPRYADAR